MQKLATLLLLFCLAGSTALAQWERNVNIPGPNPSAEVHHQLCVVNLKVTFGRPSARDRHLWGGVVPYDGLWRAGADWNTTFTLSHEITIQGEQLAPGTYGLHVIPGEENCTVIFSNDYRSWGSFSYTEANDALRITSQLEDAPYHQEQLAYYFEGGNEDQATLYLHWGKKRIPMAISIPQKQYVIEHFTTELMGPSKWSWTGHYNAAKYLYERDWEPELAEKWLDMSLAIAQSPFNLQLKAQYCYKRGEQTIGDSLLSEAVELANPTEQGNMIFVLSESGVRNDECIAWYKLTVEKFPERWRPYIMLAHAYHNDGREKERDQTARKAYEMAPNQNVKEYIISVFPAVSD